MPGRAPAVPGGAICNASAQSVSGEGRNPPVNTDSNGGSWLAVARELAPARQRSWSRLFGGASHPSASKLARHSKPAPTFGFGPALHRAVRPTTGGR
ncbi:MAG TPA: hypothetical protein DIW86_19525 [Pseudomonas sp.]|nr:hypothetical protein [Pseudomonas sp.]